MPNILLAVKHAQQEAEFARQRVRLALEAGPPEPAKGATSGGDERKLRGVPAIGRGVRGAVEGTVPHLDGLPDR